MRTALALDDELLSEAQRLTGMTEKRALVREALRALIERERSPVGQAGWDAAWTFRGTSASGRFALILVDTSVWIDRLRWQT